MKFLEVKAKTVDEAVEKALSELVEYNLKKNVSGFYVTGSTAEVYLLTEQERIDVMRMVAEMTNKRCTIIAHVGSISTDQAIRLAKEAEKFGYDAISAVTPEAFTKYSTAESTFSISKQRA